MALLVWAKIMCRIKTKSDPHLGARYTNDGSIWLFFAIFHETPKTAVVLGQIKPPGLEKPILKISLKSVEKQQNGSFVYLAPRCGFYYVTSRFMQLNCTEIVIISIGRMTKLKHENQDIRVLNFFFRLQFAISNDVIMYNLVN